MGFADRTVAEIATQLPGATAVFRAHRIDYCCGGARPLAEAAEGRGVPLAQIEAELARLAPDAAPEAPTETGALIDHILTRYHETHRRELPELVKLAARVEHATPGTTACRSG
jgi:regulator of cell morphogenesis and NO signaling